VRAGAAGAAARVGCVSREGSAGLNMRNFRVPPGPSGFSRVRRVDDLDAGEGPRSSRSPGGVWRAAIAFADIDRERDSCANRRSQLDRGGGQCGLGTRRQGPSLNPNGEIRAGGPIQRGPRVHWQGLNQLDEASAPRSSLTSEL
jgi:hypothetical protein